MKLFLGADPGMSGGIGFIPESGLAWAMKMPETDMELFSELQGVRSRYECFGLIESVHAMPKQGVSSSFKFGEGYGKLQMAFVAAGIPFDRVTPQKWQLALQCRTKGDKNISKARASELFPHIKITHAIADSLLIAEHCKRTRE